MATEPARILLCGGTGFCGAATIRAFIAMGKIGKVTAMVRDAARAKEAVDETPTTGPDGFARRLPAVCFGRPVNTSMGFSSFRIDSDCATDQ